MSSQHHDPTTSALITTLKARSFILINNRPCMILEFTTMKHGHVDIKAVDLFTRKRIESKFPGDATVDIPVVLRGKVKIKEIRNLTSCVIEREDGKIDESVTLPPDPGFVGELQEKGFEGREFDTIRAMGEEQILDKAVLDFGPID